MTTIKTKERPILFSGAMVRAILSGTKTQTRRVILWSWQSVEEEGCNLWPLEDGTYWPFNDHGGNSTPLACPYGEPGDRLWVRETWWQGQGPTWDKHCVVYDVDKSIAWTPGSGFDDFNLDEFRKRPSDHMPKWASRITLEVTGVRVERVQDITWQDAIVDGGFEPEDCCDGYACNCYGLPVYADPVLDFHTLWDSLNAKRGAGWDVNPWVWAITFRRVE